MRKEEGKIQNMKIFWVAGFLALAAGGVWAEEKPKEEKKVEPAGLSVEENLKLGRGMAFQAFTAEQQEAWRAAKDLYTAALEKAPEIPWIRLRRGFCLVKLEDLEAARLDFEKAVSQGISKDKNDAINDLQSLITLRSKAGPMAEFRDPKGAIALSIRLVELEREHGCDLVVLGKHGVSATQDLLLGSVTRHVLAEGRADVLVSTAHPAA